jgi:hypothetical protein
LIEWGKEKGDEIPLLIEWGKEKGGKPLLKTPPLIS